MSKPLPTDSILVYQHPQTRNYIAILKSKPTTNSRGSHSSPLYALKHMKPSNYVILTTGLILVDTLTSDIYPELFL